MSDQPGRPDLSDAMLRKAFLEAGTGDLTEASCERIWRAVTGELDAAERRAVVAETASDPAKAMAWRLATEIVRDARAGGALEGSPSQPHVANDVGSDLGETISAAGPDVEAVASVGGSSRVSGASWQLVAMAASTLLAVTLIVLVLQRGSLQDAVVRGGETSIEAVEGPPCTESQCRFEWSAVEEATAYRIRITTADLEVLVDRTGLLQPSFEMDLEERAAAAIAEGSLLWMVEATRADGTRVASSAFERSVSRR